MVTFFQTLIFSECNFFYLLDQIKSNCMYLFHWKSEKNRTELKKLDKLKYSKSLQQITSYTHWHAFLYSHAQLEYLFIHLKWAEGAKWARILKNTLASEQLCSLTCFLISACLNMYKNIFSFISFKIRTKNWAKWAKWAKMLKNTLTDEQLC